MLTRLAFVIAGLLMALPASAEDKIYACRGPSGQLSNVTVGSEPSCPGNKSLIFWNVQGLKGDKGDKGDSADPAVIQNLQVQIDELRAFHTPANGFFYSTDIPVGPTGGIFRLRLLTKIDPDTGTTTSVGPILGLESFSSGRLAVAPDGTLFGIARDSQNGMNVLFRLDPTTGVATVVGTPESAPSIRGLAFAADGTLFALDSGDPLQSNNTRLLTVNTVSGEATVVGTNDVRAAHLAFAPDGTLYTTSLGTLYTMDPATGITTAVGPIGSNPLSNALVSGIAFDSDGTLFGVEGAADYLITIDPETGEGTPVAPLGGRDGLIGLAFQPSTEPLP